MFHACTNPFSAPVAADRTERVGSTLCFVLMLCSWVAIYPIACPPDFPAHRAPAARVRL